MTKCQHCETRDARLCDTCSTRNAPSSRAVRDWARREKLYGNLTPAEYALFEKCAEDLR